MDVKRNRLAGACLRRLRKDAGLTQVEVGERMGKTQSYVSKVENAEREMSLVEFIFYAEAIGKGCAPGIEEVRQSLAEADLGPEFMAQAEERAR